MSLLDGIVDGVRHIFGFDSDDDDRKTVGTTSPKHAERTSIPAAETPTSYDSDSVKRAPDRRRDLDLDDVLRASRRRSISTGDDDNEPTRNAPGDVRARVFDASDPDESGSAALLGDVTQLARGSGAAVAARNVQRGLDYYADAFGRNGLDDAGSGVDVVINDRTTGDDGRELFRGNGGYYATPMEDGTEYEAIRFGTGTEYEAERGTVKQQEMFHAEDLAIHELTHGIIRMETGHLGGDADETGATNEAIADVMAAAATRDWRIGENMYTADSTYEAMRNIADPDDSTAVHGLWTDIDDVRTRQRRGAEVEEHWASGVLSTAAYRMQDRIGGEAGWQAVERVFYDTIDDNRLGDMSFTAVAEGLRASAAAEFGDSSKEYAVVDEELRRGGL